VKCNVCHTPTHALSLSHEDREGTRDREEEEEEEEEGEAEENLRVHAGMHARMLHTTPLTPRHKQRERR
jgi:hypothetical protein